MPFLPRKKNKSTDNFPWLSYFLAIINILIFISVVLVCGETINNQFFPTFKQFVTLYGFIPAKVKVLSIFTCMFLHVSFLHVLSNMYFLILFGEDIEDAIGPFLFFLCYIICGVSGTLIHYAFNMHSNIPCIGASGAVSGMMGMFIVLFPRRNLEFVWFWQLLSPPEKTEDSFQISALAWVIMWLIFQIGMGLATRGPGLAAAVAFWAHVGGALVGVLLGLAFLSAGCTAENAQSVPEQ